jgi:hypothetical protein
MSRRAGLAVLVMLIGPLLAGCQHSSGGTPGTVSSSPAGTATASAEPTGLPGAHGEQESGPRSTVLTTPKPTLSIPGGIKEVDGSCPYISSEAFADGEGSRVGRVTVLQTKPVGCRFYFQYEPSTVVGEIDIARFSTATQAYNAMVVSAKGHPEVQSDKTIGAGSLAYQTPLQGTRTWQCVFAKGTSVVTVRTRQPYPALNAFTLARAIAPKIR